MSLPRPPYTVLAPVAGALLWLCLFAAAASDITIETAGTRVEHDILLLDATARFAFGKDAIDALNSGIPLNIELDLTISRPRRFLWDSELLNAHRTFSLERHALSKKFVIADMITGERRVYGSLDLAVDEIGRIRDLAVTEAHDIDSNSTYDAALRLRLDLESLPAPMIPLAYVSPGWHMSSGWYRWQITH